MIRRIKVPEDRIAVIIGRGGKVKKALEGRTNTKISVKGEVQIEGESLDVIAAECVVIAISRGFSPQNAFELLEEEKTMSIIELTKDKEKLKRIRSRIIGTNGKCRKNIEMLTDTNISIYGRTVGIIGSHENAELAEEAISKLIAGSSHSNVYAYLEHKKG